MIKKLKSLTFLLLVTASTAFGLYELEIHEDFLDNGLRIIVVPIDSQNVVRFGVLYQVGSAYDPRCKIGLSHFLEHLMFKGTTNLSENNLKSIIDKYTIYANAYTSFEKTFFYCTVRKDFLSMFMQIEADRMENLLLKDEDIKKERDVVLEERRLRYELNPKTKYFAEVVQKSLFLYSTYSYPVVGYKEQIKNYTAKALKDHYNRFYTPKNACVIIVGDITKNEAVKMVRSTFSHIKKISSHPKIELEEDPKKTGIKHVIDRSIPEEKRASLEIVYTFDKDFSKDLKTVLVLSILESILVRDTLIKIIIDQKDLAYGLSGSANLFKSTNKMYSIEISIKETIPRKIVEKEILDIIHQFKEKYLTEELLEKVKNETINSHQLLTDNPGAVFDFIVPLISAGYKVNDITKSNTLIASITLDDIKEMFDLIFNDNNITHKIYSHPQNVEPNNIITY